MNIKKGDILTFKNSKDTSKVLAVVDGLYAVSYPEAYTDYREWLTMDRLKNIYEIPEEKWVPEEGEIYYYPEPSFIESYSSTRFYKGYEHEEHRLQNGLFFKTKEEAIACAKKMLEAIKK